MPSDYAIRARYFAPDAHLRRYFTTFFLIEIDAPEGCLLEDYLFPEWPTVRFVSGGIAEASNRDGEGIGATDFPVTGSRAQALRFRIGRARQWAMCLTPLGWAALVGGPADVFTDAIVDGNTHPAFAPFRPLARELFGDAPDAEAELGRIVRYFKQFEPLPVANEDRLVDLFATIHDPQLNSVRDLARKCGIGQRTLERICRRDFGLPPKLLLRRQRFLRSLTDYTKDPTLKWIGAIDAAYHDQAQFVRDFRRFMGVTPSEYASLEKPIVETVLLERDRYSRELVRTVRRQGDMRDYGVKS